MSEYRPIGRAICGIGCRVATTLDFRGDGEDLRYRNLRGAYMQGADLQDADLRGADFREANLRGAYFADAVFQKEDLDGART